MRIVGRNQPAGSSQLCRVMRMSMQRQAQRQQQLHAQQYSQQHEAGSPRGHERQMGKRGRHEDRGLNKHGA